jgi:hypothetical protein
MDTTELVQQMLDGVDIEALVRSEVRKLIDRNVQEAIKSTVLRFTNEMVEKEINIVLKAEPIKTDDGWGKREEYENFEELFKKHFRDKLNNDWEMKKTIDGYVKQHIEKLYESQYKVAVEKVISEMTKTIK